MEITLQIPDEIAPLFAASSAELTRQALEALAIEAYRSRKLTQFQVGQLLGLSRIQTEDFLAQHAVLYDYSVEELEAEADLLQRLHRR